MDYRSVPGGYHISAISSQPPLSMGDFVFHSQCNGLCVLAGPSTGKGWPIHWQGLAIGKGAQLLQYR